EISARPPGAEPERAGRARDAPGQNTPQVALAFDRDAAGATFLARRFTTYPVFCAAAFSLDRVPRGMLTVILQSISGGLYEDDRLAASIAAASGAAAHVTSQAGTVAHAMPHGGEARHALTIRAAAGSFVEYLPDPLILLPTSSVRTRVEVSAEVGSTVIFGEAFLSHDPESRGRPFRSLASETSLRRPGGPPLLLERFAISGGEADTAWRALLPRPAAAQGTLWVCSPHPAASLALALGTALDQVPGLCAGASVLPGNAGAIARLLAADTVALRRGFEVGWRALRRALTGEEPANRRKSGWL
ncbi:MAG TPA: urease accessory protein UreD, partial [Candidatus Methylomirabilis sp.]|nr:urease accessory protein UreD [Candidatus Methylomirabilis sp.]